jgi:hypothetical protein
LLAALANPACSSNSNTAANAAGGSAGSTAGSGGSAGAGGSGAQGGQAGGLATSDNIQIIVEPSDNGDSVVAAIKGAKTSVHVVVYLLTDNEVIQALIDRHTAGVDVRVLLNQNFYSGTTDNSTSYSKLSTAGVPVKWAPAQFNLTHQKTILIDNSVAWIMTMNLSLSSPTKNREYLAIDSEAADVAEAEAIFEGDWANTPVANPQGKLLVAPVNARAGLVALINTAATSLDVEAEVISDPGIVDALDQRADAGVKVRLVIASGTTSTSQDSAVKTLLSHGVEVKILTTPYMHAKAIVADQHYAYIGSENFTANSLDNNRELGLVTAKASEVQKVTTTIDQDFAAGTPYLLSEIDRDGAVENITNLLGERVEIKGLGKKVGLVDSVSIQDFTRISGHIDNTRRGAKWRDPLRELFAVHAGHHDIGEHERDVFAVFLAKQERLSCIRGRQDLVPR